MKKKISERFELSKYKLSAEENRTDNLLRTLRDVSNILKGWGNSYQFCNNKNLFEELDLQVDKKISEFFDHYDGVKRTLSSSEDKRRLLGIHLLSDCKSDPIVGKNKK